MYTCTYKQAIITTADILLYDFSGTSKTMEFKTLELQGLSNLDLNRLYNIDYRRKYRFSLCILCPA